MGKCGTARKPLYHFSVLSEQSHVPGFNQYCRELKCLAQGERSMRENMDHTARFRVMHPHQ